MNTILVTGATGQLGKEVVNLLLNKTTAANISVLVRDASKVADLKAKGVDIRIGSYDDYNTLVSAFKGIDKLYFISGSEISNRAQQHENVIAAAKEAGVQHVIYTSFMRKNDSASSPIAMIAASHINTEKKLRDSGLQYTILKHTIYMDMLPIFLGEKLLETGVAYLPAGDGKVAFTLRSDMAAVGAAILTTHGHENKVYDITNEQAVTLQDIANDISEITGKLISYESPTNEEYIETLTNAGVPKGYVHMFAGFAEAFKQGEMDETNHTIKELTGLTPTTVKDYLQQVYVAFKVSSEATV
ncbi:MAG: SDR family oxidoreductase [Ferruginibacter sp.]